MKHVERYCPFCKTSDYTLLDEFHGEVFCEKCGLVIQGTYNRNSIVELENKAEKKYFGFKLKKKRNN